MSKKFIGKIRSVGMVLWLSAALGWTALASQAVMAEDDAGTFEAVESGDETIRVRPSGGSNRPVKDALKVRLSPEKKAYRVNDRIRFKVSGNKKFYLYMFNIDSRTGKGTTILPNRYQGKKSNMYTAGGWHVVPNASLEFFADRPGRERIIMVASERYVDVDKLLQSGRSKSLGNFYEMESVTDGLDEALTLLAASDGDETIKVRVRQSKSRLPKGVVVQEVNLRIR